MLLVCINALRESAFMSAFTSMFVMLNNCVPASRRASLNGLAMTVASIGKAVGPPTGASCRHLRIAPGFHALTTHTTTHPHEHTHNAHHPQEALRSRGPSRTDLASRSTGGLCLSRGRLWVAPWPPQPGVCPGR